MVRRRGLPILALSIFALAVAALGCDDTGLDTVEPSQPSLTITGSGPCETNLLPVANIDQVQNRTYVALDLRIMGTDAATGTGELVPGTEVLLTALETADGRGRFTSSDRDTSEVIPFVGRYARDGFYCAAVGTVMVQALVTGYQAGGDGVAADLATPTTRAFPVRCVSPAEYTQRCDPLNVDFGELADAADVGVDAGDAGLDAAPLPLWSIQAVPLEPGAEVIAVRGGGAGRADSVLLTFKVYEGETNIADVPVVFSVAENAPPGVRIDPLEGVTDGAGFVTVRLFAGNVPGVVGVKATATRGEGEQEALSPTITIRAGLPSGRSFYLLCDDPVVPAFTYRLTPTHWLLDNLPLTECQVDLGDAFSGRVDNTTQVFFMTEAGTVDQAVSTDEDGIARTRLRATEPAPYDTAPNDYEIDNALVWEPQDAHGEYNPRDGLVRIIAVTRGAEGFVDLNGDGFYRMEDGDVLLPEHDLPDPFVDINDDGVWNESLPVEVEENGQWRTERVAEPFRDANSEGNEAGIWSPANGEWDGDTEIWTATTVLWVGRLPAAQTDRPDNEIHVWAECRGPGCARNAIEAGSVEACQGVAAQFYLGAEGGLLIKTAFHDENFNCMDAHREGSISLKVEGSAGELVTASPIGLDGQCFRLQIPEEPGATSRADIGSFAPEGFLVMDTVGLIEEDPENPTDPSVSRIFVELSYKAARGETRVVSSGAITVCR